MDTPAALAPLAVELTKMNSRDALAERLAGLLADLPPAEAIALIADILWLWRQDRQQLIARTAALLDRQHARRSEKATDAQIALFNKVIEVLAQAEADEGLTPSSSSAEPNSSVSTGEPPPPSAAEVRELLNRTNEEIEQTKQLLARQRQAANEAAREERARARANGSPDAAPWPDNLPVEFRRLEPLEGHQECGGCQRPRSVARYERSWVVERRTETVVVVTETPVLMCTAHHGGPVQAPAPPRPVPGGRLGFSVAADFLYLRIVQNLPTRRIVEMLASEGVPITEDMAHTLLRVTGEAVKPVSEALHGQVQVADLVNLDDTPVAVHIGESPRIRTTARVWLALGDRKFAWFFATKTWKAKEAEAKLGSITGTLQGDGYGGFAAYAATQGVKLAGCMDHLRRKLLKASKAGDPRATYPLALVQGLYRVDELARLTEASPERVLALRQERAVPLFRALLAWLEEARPTIVTGSPIGKAWTYLNNQRGPLAAWLSDPLITISNAAAERGLRRITIGRKLWLFHRGHESLDHVTRWLSVAYTARMHSVDERTYMEWLLRRLADREWSVDAAIALLPAAFKAQQDAE